MTARIIRNARIVTASEEFLGCVAIEDGRIRAVERGGTSVTGTEDWAGDWLLPGLVELHTDNLEKHISPRPGVIWNAHSAMVAHDAQCAAAGITTVFDSIVIGDMDRGGARSRTQHTSIEALHDCAGVGLLHVDHWLHLRCEVSVSDVAEVLDRYADDPLLRLVSVMDHTPGQRQWRDLKSYRRYAERNGGFADAEFSRMIEQRQDDQRRFAATNRAAVIELCRRRGLPVASHDDTELEHVAQAHAEAISISEFPTTVAAARAAREAGMSIVMGGPNLVTGGSHSGNVSAAELAGLDLLDIFSSDYVPSSLLLAAFKLREALDWQLPRAIATVTRNPARAVGLPDRGEIAAGLRADLIRVRRAKAMPFVVATLRASPPP
ncbi:MAG: alpha-D-ribose 1-methylphosphonate 5-triphosphate diphosphatase [Caldimonas sp.]